MDETNTGEEVGARRRRKKPQDQHLPGMEPTTIPEVHAAIEAYVAARDQRMELTKVEVERKAELMRAMKKAGIADYDVAGHEAHLEVEEQVKAKLKAQEGAEPRTEPERERAVYVMRCGCERADDENGLPLKLCLEHAAGDDDRG